MLSKLYALILLIALCNIAYTQKDCTHDNTGLIPITDLGIDKYRGVMGGLYPGGSNTRPPAYLTKCIEHVQAIEPLDHEGEYSDDGRIVMLGIGASNPGSEFQRFKEIAEVFEPLNDDLAILNVSEPSVGIQEMYNVSEDYWEHVEDILSSNDLTAEQVQIIWIEEENTETGDTAFPAAAVSLVNDYLNLLQTIKILFPNTQICYLTARAYSGYAVPDAGTDNGLMFPRDYMNGWALKWFIENVINNELGYDYSDPDAEIPLVTWGSYHWTDGSTPREDGLFLDCELDVGADGLHLTGAGEYKMGMQMFNYFSTDTTAKYWFYDEGYTGIYDHAKENAIQVYPNPVSGEKLHISTDVFQQNESVTISIYSTEGQLQISNQLHYTDNMTLEIDVLPAGIYVLQMQSETKSTTKQFVITP